MARFSYKVQGSDGRAQTGIVEATSKSGALEVLIARGQTPLKLHAVGDKS